MTDCSKERSVLQLTSLSDLHLSSGRKIADVRTVVLPGYDSRYVIIKTRSGYQCQRVLLSGHRICIAVDCLSESDAISKCKQDHINFLTTQINNLKLELEEL